MKLVKRKTIIVGILVLTLCLLGSCGLNKNNSKKIKTDHKWKVIGFKNKKSINDEYTKIFDEAIKKTDYNFAVVSLLAKQVVSGNNYMFLVFDKDKKAYKFVTINKNLDDEVSMLFINDFDFRKYVNENKKAENETITGGWEVNNYLNGNTLSDKQMKLFKESRKKIKDLSFTPIKVLAYQKKSGTNYAYLCYGTSKDGTTNLYLLTIYEEHNTTKIVSICHINPADFVR